MAIRIVKPVTWFWGLLAGFIQGGALAFTTGPTAALFAPSEFNIKTPQGFKNLMLFMIIVFIQAGTGGAMFYLAKTPVPQLIENGGGDTEMLKKSEQMKTLILILLVALVTGCVASRIVNPYIKETITSKDGTTRTIETSADTIEGAGIDAMKKLAPTR